MKQQVQLNPEDSTYDYILQIRGRMINGVLIAFACVAPFMLIISLTRAVQHGWSPIYILHSCLAVVTLLAAIFRNRLPYSLRVSLFLGIAFVLGAMGVPTFGLVGGGHLVLIIFSILAAIGFGTRIGLFACLVNIILMFAIGTAVCTGQIAFDFDIAEFATSPSAWGAVIIDFILIIPMAVLAIGSVFSQLQTLLKQLRENHAAHQRLADNLTDSFLYRFSGGGKMEYVSSSAEQILGYSQEELKSLPQYLTKLETNKTAFRICTDKGSVEQKRRPFETQLYHKNGSKRWFHMSETAVETLYGTKVEGVAHDITRRKIREMAIENILKTFEAGSGTELYKELVKQLAITLQCDIAFFSRLNDSSTGMVHTEALFVDGEITENIDYQFAGSPCEAMADTGLSFWSFGIRDAFPEAVLLREHGIEGYGGLRVYDQSGNHIGYLAAFWKEPAFLSELMEPVFTMYAKHLAVEFERRMDEEKHNLLEEQLRQSQKMDAVGQLAGGIAHDFNNMLMGIMGASDLLKMRLNDDPEAEEYHGMIRNSSRRAADLTSQLLTFARKRSIGTAKMDVHESIEHAVSLLSNTLDRRIMLQTDLQANQSTIIGDSSQIQNAIMNLGINAAHAMPNGGRVHIITNIKQLDETYCSKSTFPLEPGHFLSIRVQDEGYGIPCDQLDQIFEPFFTTKAPGKGTGLGLSTTLGTVQQHHGEILVESTPKTGTTFTLNLPLTSDSKNSAANEINEISNGSGRILLIEDEEIIRATLSSMLTHLGFSVTTADNGKIGIDQFRENDFDLVILDMMMPEMNGMDCFFQLKEIDNDVRVILCSGFAEDEDIRKMKCAGLRAVLTKPVSSTQLSRTVINVLSRKTA